MCIFIDPLCFKLELRGCHFCLLIERMSNNNEFPLQRCPILKNFLNKVDVVSDKTPVLFLFCKILRVSLMFALFVLK